jgi:hypothetical protein
MPSRTDDPPRTRPEIVAVPDSRLEAPPAAGPELETRDDDLLTQESFRAVLSSRQQGGRWEPADEIQVLSICGEVTLDFTHADLPPSGEIDIEARAICGEIKIIVPDGAEVELEARPFVGSIEQQARKKGWREGIREWVTGEREEDLPAPPRTAAPPYFRIDGRAIFGAIKVVGR